MCLIKRILNYKTALFFVTGLSLVSCKSSYVVLTIENSQPASEELSPDIQSITLMNRSMSSQFENYNQDSLQKYYYRKGYQLSKIVLDSAASDTTIRALAGLLFESGRYDVVVPVNRNIKRDFSYEILPDTLSPAVVSQICTDYKTDALLVLERFSTKTMADFTAEKYQNPVGGNNYSYYASLDLKYDAFLRIYKPGKKTLVKEFELSDTISWESADYSQVRLFSKMPSIKQAMINAGIKVALSVDDKLSPTWVPEKRGFFLIKPNGDRGEQLMNEKKYDEAGQYWDALTKSKNKKIRSKAEFNKALISELDGDIDGAIKWGLKSFYSYYRQQTETYLKKLQSRKLTLQKQ